jgi:hypothetical protein
MLDLSQTISGRLKYIMLRILSLMLIIQYREIVWVVGAEDCGMFSAKGRDG